MSDFNLRWKYVSSSLLFGFFVFGYCVRWDITCYTANDN